jgi:glucose/arabinose dehydrogenase
VTGLAAPIAYVDPPDGLPHRLIAEQEGRIEVWDGSSATPNATPFLDLRDDPAVPSGQRKVLCCGERGLLAIAAHPDYRANGFLYLYYTSRDWDGAGGIASGDVVIERYARSAANPEVADPASAQIVLVVARNPAIGNHNGGDLKFGRDGRLYVTIGDGGSGCDAAFHSAQDVNQLLGKMLRLDVDSGDDFPGEPLRNYRVPPDNPLVGFPGRAEIWALGLRNPFRFTFDRGTGDAYVGDVGQDDWEELNRLPAGAVAAGAPVNFGWPCREGFVGSECDDPPQGCGAAFTPPVRVEPNAGEGGSWRAIMAGYFYRGRRLLADLSGQVVYGDAGNADVWAATPGSTTPPGWSTTMLHGSQGPYGFGEDSEGELYLLSALHGELRCLELAGDAACSTWAALPDLVVSGFETGNLAAWAP